MHNFEKVNKVELLLQVWVTQAVTHQGSALQILLEFAKDFNIGFA